MTQQKDSENQPSELDLEDHLICFCHTVPKSQILEAIRSGSKTFEEIQADTCASTGCGSCEFDVRDLLAQVLKDSKKTG